MGGHAQPQEPLAEEIDAVLDEDLDALLKYALADVPSTPSDPYSMDVNVPTTPTTPPTTASPTKTVDNYRNFGHLFPKELADPSIFEKGSEEWCAAVQDRRTCAASIVQSMSHGERTKMYSALDRRSSKGLTSSGLAVYLATKGKKDRRRALLELFLSNDGDLNNAVRVYVEEDMEVIDAEEHEEWWEWLTEKQLECKYPPETVKGIIAEKKKNPAFWQACEDCPTDEDAFHYRCWKGKRENKKHTSLERSTTRISSRLQPSLGDTSAASRQSSSMLMDILDRDRSGQNFEQPNKETSGGKSDDLAKPGGPRKGGRTKWSSSSSSSSCSNCRRRRRCTGAEATETPGHEEGEVCRRQGCRLGHFADGAEA
jgi:hypothetical protein